jgi:hypothetical protein
MAVEPRTRWPDERIDDLKQQVEMLIPVVKTVSVLEERMIGLTREMRLNTTATEKVSHQLEEAQIEPFKQGRLLRQQVLVAVIAALVGGGLAAIAAVVSAHA